MKTKPKILLIEDDAGIVGGLEKELLAEGYEVVATRGPWPRLPGGITCCKQAHHPNHPFWRDTSCLFPIR